MLSNYNPIYIFIDLSIQMIYVYIFKKETFIYITLCNHM